MTVFWIVVALFLIGALLLLLPPLWSVPPAVDDAAGVNIAVYRDQWREAGNELASGALAPDRLAQVRADIERRVLEDAPPAAAAAVAAAPARRTALVLALLIPLASVATYLALGNPQAARPATPPGAPVAGDGGGRHTVTPEQIQAMATSLAERLKADPSDGEGWAMLARSYTALGRYRDAVTAFRRADELTPGRPALLADHADVLGMLQGKRLAGEPSRLIQRALDADPRHPKALSLAGSAAFEARDYGAARGYWERLAAILPPGSNLARSVQGSIAEARRLEGTAAPDTPVAQAGGSVIVGEVEVAAGLRDRIAPGDTLFVFARAAQGPRQPLAIVRRPVGEWPAPFRLDDSMAMSADLRLSAFAQVVVGVRISRSGNATPQPGDLIGHSEALAPGGTPLRLRVDQVQP